MRLLALKVLLIFLIFWVGCTQTTSQKIKIVATTSLIETIVKEVGKDQVEVVSIVPSGMCPGHFDIKPRDIVAASQAKLLLNHGFEKWMSRLLNSVDNRELKVKTIQLKGNWMVPEVHIQAVEKITAILCQLDIDHGHQYQKNSKEYIQRIRSAATQIKKFKDTKAIAARFQVPFVEWLGIKVIASYGRGEELTPQEIARLISLGRKGKVELVIDNLQSGPNAGREIAKEIKAKHVILTNFPLNSSYLTTLSQNVEKIAQALE